jgi:cytoskeletal protein CcmA (bactofilin family)
MIWKKSDSEEPVITPPPQPQPQYQPPAAPAPAPRPQAPPKERALIGPSIEIKGDLRGGEDLFVEGKVEGKIELRQHSVTIGKGGRVKADVFGRSIVVLGEVHGNLFAEEQIILRQACVVRGNLTAPRVALEEGSSFKGSIDMTAAESGEAHSRPKTGSSEGTS